MRIAAWISFAVLLGLGLLTPITDSDVFFGMSLGRLLLETGIPAQDPYLYTPFQDWNVHHQWLGNLIFYFFYQVGEVPGLYALRFLLWFGIFTVLFWKSKTWKNNEAVTILIFTAAAFVSSQRFIDRSSVFSDLLMISFSALLIDRRKLSSRILLLIPCLMALWVNLHAGFVMGLAVYSVYILSRGRQIDWPHILSLMGSYIACLLNPLGWKGIFYPLQTVLKPQWAIYRSWHLEWKPLYSEPFLYAWETWTLLALFLLATLSLIAVFQSSRSRNLFPFFLLLIFSYFALDASRFASTSALGFSLIALHSLEQLKWKISPRFNLILNSILILGLSLTSLSIAMFGYSLVYGPQKVEAGIDESALPVQATEFIERNHLQGRFFNQYEWGAYLVWRLNRPKSLFIHTFVDDPQVLIQSYYGINQRQFVFLETVQKYGIQYFLLDRKIFFVEPRPNLLKFLEDWKIIYQDNTAVLWEKPKSIK